MVQPNPIDLICNQLIADLTSSIFCAVIFSGGLTYYVTVYHEGHWPELLRVWPYLFLILLPPRIALSASQKSAIMVGFDRIFLLFFPHKWVRMGGRYRNGLVTIVWEWAISQEIWPYDLLYAPSSTNSYAPYKKYMIYYYALSAVDISLLLIILYIFIMFASAKFCQRAANGNESIQVYCHGLEETQRTIVARIKILALLTVISHLLMSVAVLSVNSLSSCTSMTVFGTCLPVGLCFTILPLYVFAWKDAVFREELIKVLESVFLKLMFRSGV